MQCKLPKFLQPQLWLLGILFNLFLTTWTMAWSAQLQLNRDYGELQSVPVPHEFSLTYPDRGVQWISPQQSQKTGALATLNIFDGQQHIKESLTLKWSRIRLIDETAAIEKGGRLALAQAVVMEQINLYPEGVLVQFSEQTIGVHKTAVGLAKQGPHFMAVVVFLNPNSIHCPVAVVHAIPHALEAKQFQELFSKTDALKILQTLKLGRELM